MVGILTPLCQMPDCDSVEVSSCSDFKPACGDCPEAVVMKHLPDDAVTSSAPALGQLAVLAHLETPAEAIIVEPVAAVPEATAAPPPLDPLGVRLTV